MKAADYRRRVTLAMDEDELLENIRQLALTTGWAMYHTRDSRGSDAGWPDLVLAHRAKRRVLFVELKTARGSLRAGQKIWLTVLTACGLETAVWRPAQWADGTIQAVLNGAAARSEPRTAPERVRMSPESIELIRNTLGVWEDNAAGFGCSLPHPAEWYRARIADFEQLLALVDPTEPAESS
jgi:hypothetical protein